MLESKRQRMSGKIPQSTIDRVRKQYESGWSYSVIAKCENVAVYTVQRWLQIAGVKARPRALSVAMANKHLNLMPPLITAYLAGESQCSLADRLGINRDVHVGYQDPMDSARCRDSMKRLAELTWASCYVWMRDKSAAFSEQCADDCARFVENVRRDPARMRIVSVPVRVVTPDAKVIYNSKINGAAIHHLHYHDSELKLLLPTLSPRGLWSVGQQPPHPAL